MKERDDFEPNNSNSDLEPVASHSSGVGNSIEQDVDLFDEWANAHKQTQRIVSKAKRYIVNNWKAVTDPSSIWIHGYDNQDNTFHYSPTKNPVKTIDDVVLDSIDGDFSICINGNWHNWVNDECVAIMAKGIQSLLNSPTAAQECDASKAPSMREPMANNSPKDEGIEKLAEEYYEGYVMYERNYVSGTLRKSIIAAMIEMYNAAKTTK